MAHLNIYTDQETANLLRINADKQNVSVSHYINNLIQRALIQEANSEVKETILAHPKFFTAIKKLLVFNTKSLALTRYLVENLGDEQQEKANVEMLQKAKLHAESYASGLLEE